MAGAWSGAAAYVEVIPAWLSRQTGLRAHRSNLIRAMPAQGHASIQLLLMKRDADNSSSTMSTDKITFLTNWCKE